MRRFMGHAILNQLTRQSREQLPDGVGGTIAGGGRVEPAMMATLNPGGRGARGGGAVSGAAQAMSGGPGRRGGQDRGIALSDGSRITFASIGDVGILNELKALLRSEL